MGRRLDTLLLTVANLLIPVAVLVFAAGFFPYKPFVPGLAEFERLEYGAPPQAPFDRVVFMVVDALRSDFVFGEGSGFGFTQGLIRKGEAMPFTAHATSPTITMPRVKAITTGSIPSFLDVILNFAESDTTSTLAHQDTWLAQIRKRGGKLVMYGDDTWLKLFPDMFGRADGTSSFFVSDFTEVDNNVTRHVSTELHNRDWEAWIMHYLGLDHIGHKAGPNSPNMLPKQKEMDDIVRSIYTEIATQPELANTLFVLCGDHGMNEGGNHGGSAPGETSPALVFMSPKLKTISNGMESPTDPSDDYEFYTKIEQSDVAPTIAGLLGFPVPLNNLGVFIPNFLGLWDKGDDRVQLLLRNAKQMLSIVKATFPHPSFENPLVEMKCEGGLSTGMDLACRWRRVTNLFQAAGSLRPPPEKMIPLLMDFCREAQDVMSSTSSNYNVSLLVTGILVSLCSLTLALVSMKSSIIAKPTLTGAVFALLTLLYGIMMFASSYVEEEQHLWYWLTTFWIGFLYFYTTQSDLSSPEPRAPMLLYIAPFAVILFFHRLTRRWNQTGQKYAGAPDVALYLGQHPVLLWTLVVATYFHLTSRLRQSLGRFIPLDFELGSVTAASTFAMTALAFKLAFTAHDAPELVEWIPKNFLDGLKEAPLVGLARASFLGAGIALVWVVFCALRWRNTSTAKETYREQNTLVSALHDVLTLLLLTQTRTTSIPLFLFFHFQLRLLANLPLTVTQKTITAALFLHTSFFALGNSNAISSIDLSNAYNGVSGYNVAMVGILLFIGNWAGPLWWGVGGLVLLTSKPPSSTPPPPKTDRKWVQQEYVALQEASEKDDAKLDGMHPTPLFRHLGLLTVFTSASLVAVQAACTALRTHLFIWTVFSPKYLYAMAWAVGYHLVISVGLGSAVWAARGL